MGSDSVADLEGEAAMGRRAIVVVHGVGSQRKGESLNQVAEPLVRYLRWHMGRREEDPETVRLDVDLRPDHGPARITIRFTLGSQTEEWKITEAWWAERFHPSPADFVMRWGFAVLVHHAGSIVFGLFLRHLPVYRARTHPPSFDPAYRSPSVTALSRAWDVLVALVVGVVYVPAWIAALFLASLFYIVAQLPPWLLVPQPAAAFQRALINALVHGVGDQQVMTSNYVARDAAARSVVETLAPHLWREHPDYRSCDTVTVIAHSGGCVVSYHALSDWDVKAWLGSDAEGRSRLTWFTVGSGLNLAYGMGWRDRFWDRGLARQIKWVDVWARYDPVPHGQARPEMVQRIRGSGGGFENVRVVNRENPFGDHGAYWSNYEEVVSRFVYEIMGELPQDDTLRASLQPSLEEIDRHRTGVARFVWIRAAIALLVVLAARVGDQGARLGGSLLDRLPGLTSMEWPLGSLARWLAPWDDSLAARSSLGPVGPDALLGLALLGVGAYLAYRLVTLWWRGLLERNEDWR
ncbi:MAG: hypothetical protein GEU73_12635 [Chloroflexi bacterium]|nr:hypothetical protein [Chloroflexota bacterium]